MAYGMTNNNWEKVKEELTCAICQDLLNEPRSLPCLHSFYTGCLKELLAGLNSSKYQLECPLCRAKVSLSASRAIEELPVNFVTNRLIEIFRCEEQARLHTIPPSATSLDPEATVNGTSSQPPSVQSRLGYCSSSRSPPPPSRSWLLSPLPRQPIRNSSGSNLASMGSPPALPGRITPPPHSHPPPPPPSRNTSLTKDVRQKPLPPPSSSRHSHPLPLTLLPDHSVGGMKRALPPPLPAHRISVSSLISEFESRFNTSDNSPELLRSGPETQRQKRRVRSGDTHHSETSPPPPPPLGRRSHHSPPPPSRRSYPPPSGRKLHHPPPPPPSRGSPLPPPSGKRLHRYPLIPSQRSPPPPSGRRSHCFPPPPS